MQKVSKNLKKLLKLLEKNLNLVVLIIFAIVILYASWLLYVFILRPISTVPDVSIEKIEIKKTTFDKVIEHFNARESNISAGANKKYRDIFR